MPWQCWLCPQSIRTASDRTKAAFEDGSMMPPDTVLEAQEIAPAANRSSEFCHKACKRKLNDVRRVHTEAGRHLGVRAAWAPKPALARAGTSAKDKSSSLVDEAVPMLAESLISRGCTIMMIDDEAVQMYESAQSGDSGGSVPQQTPVSDESTNGIFVHSWLFNERCVQQL
jgi:hypothetical protein